MKKFCYIFVLCLLIVISVYPICAASPAEKKLSFDVSVQQRPKIYYPYVIWLDWRNDADGAWTMAGGADKRNKRDVYLFDLISGVEKRITDEKNLPTNIAITKNYVFWLDARPDAPGLYQYNIVNGKSGLAVTLSDHDAFSEFAGNRLAASNDQAVYATHNNGAVWHYHAGNGINKKVASVFVNGIDFNDNKIVWTNASTDNSDVYLYDLETGKTTRITDNGNAAPFNDNVAIGADKIVFLAGDVAPNVKSYDILTGKIENLTISESVRLLPRVSTDAAVWSEWSVKQNKYLLAVYDYKKNKLAMLDKNQALNADIDASRVVFESRRDNDTDIYLADISPENQLEESSASKVEEKEKPLGVESGDLIKGSSAAIYYYGADAKRYVFPNQKTYFTWYVDFKNVKKISDEELIDIEIGGNVTYRPGIKLIKAQSAGKVYAVDKNGTRRWLMSADVAEAIFGKEWKNKVNDIPDAFWTNYKNGTDISAKEDYNREATMAGSPDINADKELK